MSADHAGRLARLAAATGDAGLDALLIGIGPDLAWATGYAGHGLERMNLLVVRPTGQAVLVAPRLEAPAAMAAPAMAGGAVAVRAWDETDDPVALVTPLVTDAADPAARVAVSDGLRAAFVLRLQAALPAATFSLASAVVAPLRRVKDASEIEALRDAAHAADRVVTEMIGGPLVGRTERDVASEVRARLVDAGHDTAEFAIVAGGPNSASPHHEPGDRPIGAGEALLFDIGGRRAGYCSDITRTVWVAGADGAGPDDDFVRVYELVRDAQAAASAAVRPGAALEDLDAAARDVIRAGGHGDGFIHRLGHGIGLEVHEEPYLVAGRTDVLAAGETFSLEPGVYLPDRFGVRIEDQVVCTVDGADHLNRAPRELLVVDGV